MKPGPKPKPFRYRELRPRITSRKMEGGNTLHIEAPGVIVNVKVGLTDGMGRTVTHIEVHADGDRYVGNDTWWIDGEAGQNHQGLRVIRTEKAR